MDRKGKLAYDERLQPTARSDGRTRPSSGYLYLQKGASNQNSNPENKHDIQSLSLKPTHPPQLHIPTKSNMCRSCGEVSYVHFMSRIAKVKAERNE